MPSPLKPGLLHTRMVVAAAATTSGVADPRWRRHLWRRWATSRSTMYEVSPSPIHDRL